MVFARLLKTRLGYGHRSSALQPHDSGADQDRTDDLRLAKPALSQLSYSPEGEDAAVKQHQWAREDLNFRPHAYQACALTT